MLYFHSDTVCWTLHLAWGTGLAPSYIRPLCTKCCAGVTRAPLTLHIEVNRPPPCTFFVITNTISLPHSWNANVSRPSRFGEMQRISRNVELCISTFRAVLHMNHPLKARASSVQATQVCSYVISLCPMVPWAQFRQLPAHILTKSTVRAPQLLEWCALARPTQPTPI